MEVTRTFDILDRYLQEFPREDAIAGKKDGSWITYSTSEYVDNANCFAMGMMSLGIRQGDKVATVANNRPEWNFVDMGLAMAGAVHLPIYPTNSDEEFQYVIGHAEARCVIVGDKKLYDKLKVAVGNLNCVSAIYSFDRIDDCQSVQDIIDLGRSNADTLSEQLSRLKESISPDDMVTLIYTSGTTGIPKGVMLSHNNLISNVMGHVQMHHLGSSHRVISFLPLCHIYERSLNYHFQYKGMGIYYVGSLGLILDAIKEIKPHLFNSVPRLLERVYDGFLSKGQELKGLKKTIYFWAISLTRHYEHNKKYGIFVRLQRTIADRLVYSKWREALGNEIVYIVSGGAALQSRIAKVFGMAGMTVLEGYGLTETSPVIAVSHPVRKLLKVGTVGAAMPGMEIKIADDGEILCKGPSVMKGYYKDPKLTAQAIDSEGWFHTGDIGVFEEGIYLRITDRKKEIFKISGGKYIAPQMIENKLKESYFIEQVMVIGENQKFASALVSPNFQYLSHWAAQHGIQYGDKEELISNTQVLKQYTQEVDAINKTLALHEEIKRFRLVASEWSIASGELSPTLKLRRRFIEKKYKDIIDDIFQTGKSPSVESNGLKLPRLGLRTKQRTTDTEP